MPHHNHRTFDLNDEFVPLESEPADRGKVAGMESRASAILGERTVLVGARPPSSPASVNLGRAKCLARKLAEVAGDLFLLLRDLRQDSARGDRTDQLAM